jgi:hypothetical protein
MTSTPSSPEDAARVLSEAISLLRDFLRAPQPFAISNDSLSDIIRIFGDRLERALRQGKASDLLLSWRQQMPQARDQLLKAGDRHPVTFRDGGSLPLLTENEAARLGRLCPDGPEF